MQIRARFDGENRPIEKERLRFAPESEAARAFGRIRAGVRRRTGGGR